MPDLTLYRDDILLLRYALAVASARVQRHGLMEDSEAMESLYNRLENVSRLGELPALPALEDGELD